MKLTRSLVVELSTSSWTVEGWAWYIHGILSCDVVSRVYGVLASRTLHKYWHSVM